MHFIFSFHCFGNDVSLVFHKITVYDHAILILVDKYVYTTSHSEDDTWIPTSHVHDVIRGKLHRQYDIDHPNNVTLSRLYCTLNLEWNNRLVSDSSHSLAPVNMVLAGSRPMRASPVIPKDKKTVGPISFWYIEGILPKGPYPPWLRMADKALLAGYPRYRVCHTERHKSDTSRGSHCRGYHPITCHVVKSLKIIWG